MRDDRAVYEAKEEDEGGGEEQEPSRSNSAAAEWGGVKVVTPFKSVYETVYVSTSSRRALLTFCLTTG